MDTLKDHLKSKSNIKFLEAFAYDKLSKEFPSSLKTQLIETVSFEIENFIDTVYVPPWDITAENIAEMNGRIWKNIRPRIITSMSSRIPDNNVVIEPRTFVDENSESKSVERPSFHEEQYRKMWN